MNENPAADARSAVGHAASASRLAALRHPRVMSLAMVAAIALLFALSVMRTYALGQHERMYDNPVYRWRESLAIALSRMQTPPLHGYLAYRSIRNYLAEHGLALVAGEAPVLSTPEQRRALVRDTAGMNRLLQEASRTPIDPQLPPVILAGNELGQADYFYWSFRLFGLNLHALVLFYYSILLVSVVLFFLAFRHSPFALLLLMLYLVGHYFAVNFSEMPLIQTIHNSRFFGVLSLLPALHLLLLLWRRDPAGIGNVVAAAVQAFILFFIVFCRNEAFWQVLAILASALVAVSFRDLWRALPRPLLWPATIRTTARDTWPALLVAGGLAGFVAYNSLVPDGRHYGAEAKAHVFWHAVYVGLISADPELTALYGYGEVPYSDSVGFSAALHDVRGRNEAPRPFAEVVDGVTSINFLRDTDAYEKVLRRLFFQVVAEHPWLTLRSFLVGKPADQLEIMTHVAPLRDVRTYVEVLLLGFAASLLARFAGAGLPGRERVRQAGIALIPLAICSLITTFIVPTALIPDVIVFYLMVVLLAVTYLGVAQFGGAARRPSAMARP